MKSKITGRSALTRLTIAAIFMALTIALCSFSIPVPGGHLYLCDVAICTAALLLDPFLAFVAGGVGAFFGDLIFYPLPMFVSLVTHGLQAVLISLFARYILKKRPRLSSVIGLALGSIVMVTGYSLGRAFIYATPEYAVVKLPYEILQALIGAVLGFLLYWKTPLKRLYDRMTAN
ncbi:MAG: ECF transporter S component [Ruminococcaceae bacterium]|nr:ECF transporter S component [Oscillospiraceae bacterium]